MKRADIKPGQLLGYYEGRDPRYYVRPYIVLSTDLYQRSRARGAVTPASKGDRMGSGRGYFGTSVGMLAVHVHDAAQADRVRELASVGCAIEALSYDNDVTTSILGGLDADGEYITIGSYDLVTSSAYFHGDYDELQAQFRERKRQEEENKRAIEATRRTESATYDALNARLEALGITGYARANWQNKHHFDNLRFADMAELLDLAERGMQSVPNIS